MADAINLAQCLADISRHMCNTHPENKVSIKKKKKSKQNYQNYLQRERDRIKNGLGMTTGKTENKKKTKKSTQD